MKSLLTAILLVLSLTANAQHERQIVETSPLARALLTNDTAGQWLSVLGTNLFPTNFPALGPAQIFIGSAAGAAIATNVSGDVTANTNGVFTLANSGVSAGSATKVTVNAKGLVTGTNSLSSNDIPTLDASKIGTGILAVAQGGTGKAYLNPSTFFIGNASSNITETNMSGDATMDNSGVVTLSTNTVVAGSGVTITFNAKGLVTATNTLSSNNVPGLPWSKITSGTPTLLSGYGITDGNGTALTATNTNNAVAGNFSGTFTSTMVFGTAAQGIRLTTNNLGSPAFIGTSTLSSGVVIVTNSAVTANSMIFLQHANSNGVPGILSYTVNPSVSFTIISSTNSDAANVNWIIFERR